MLSVSRKCSIVIFTILAAQTLGALMYVSYEASRKGSWISSKLGNNTIMSVSREFLIPLQPADWTFSIWGLIYLMQIVWVLASLAIIFIWQDYIVSLCPVSMITFSIANIMLGVWCYTFLSRMMTASFFVLLISAFLLSDSLVRAYKGIEHKRKHLSKHYCIFMKIFLVNGLGIYYGWVTVASTLAFQIMSIYDFGLKPITSSVVTLLYLILSCLAYTQYSMVYGFTLSTPLVVVLYAIVGILYNIIKDGASTIYIYALVLAFGIVLIIIFGHFYFSYTSNYEIEDEKFIVG